MRWIYGECGGEVVGDELLWKWEWFECVWRWVKWWIRIWWCEIWCVGGGWDVVECDGGEKWVCSGDFVIL